MRCARCDRLAFPQVVARMPDGRLVFGWCPDCLEREGCTLVEGEAARLAPAPREPLARRLRRFRRRLRVRRRWGSSRPRASTQRLAALGVAGLMTAWALILAFIGGLRLIQSDDAKGPLLLAGSGAMAITSLVVWFLLIGRAEGLGMLLKVVQVAAAIVAFGTLARGILQNRKADAPRIVGIAAVALAISWGARKIELSRSAARSQEAAPKP